MQKFLKLSCLLMLISAFSCLASPISQKMAEKVAKKYFSLIESKETSLLGNSEISLVLTSQNIFKNSIQADRTPTFYIFNNECGWVIIAGDDLATPVLAYSIEGQFPTENVPPNAKYWLESYNYEISNAQTGSSRVQSAEIASAWQSLLSDSPDTPKIQAVVEPLIKTKWDQDEPYNLLCPKPQNNPRAVTGCVATAMAQLMKYWNYPVKGKGEHEYIENNFGRLVADFKSTKYDWANMTNTYSSNSTDVQNIAVATLMYHCGVALEMDYYYGGENQSGTRSEMIPKALVRYFGYKNTCQTISRKLNENEWLNIIKAELNSNRPMEYSGNSSGMGHSFICDGYDNSNKLHFNFGWSGFCDGYYNIDNVIPADPGTGAGNGNYSYNQAANIGIECPSEAEASTSAIIAVSDEFTVLTNNPSVNGQLSVRMNFTNIGSESFVGDIQLCLFDSLGYWVRELGSFQVDELLPNYHYQNSKEFNIENLYETHPGIYYLAATFRRSDASNASLCEESGNIKNIRRIVLSACTYDNQEIELLAEPGITPLNVNQGDVLTAAAKFKNNGNSNFVGSIWAEVVSLATKEKFDTEWNDCTIGPQDSTHFYSVFRVLTQNLMPGDYYISFKTFNNANKFVRYVNSGNFTHTIKFTVDQPAIKQDKYEPNNTAETAYKLFTTQYKTDTTRSIKVDLTMHYGDKDYFAFDLPKGFSYDVKFELEDAFNCKNFEYSIDVMMNVSFGGVDLAFNEDSEFSTTVQEGGNLLLYLFPYEENRVGTYRLKISITQHRNLNIVDEDEFEPNDSKSMAYDISQLHYSYGENDDWRNATFHNIPDKFDTDTYDYYLVDLPKGYIYSAYVETIDKSTSPEFSADVAFKLMRTSDLTWSSEYEDVKSETMNFSDGEKFYIMVYKKGDRFGDYQLHINVNKERTTGVEGSNQADAMLVTTPERLTVTSVNSLIPQKIVIIDATGSTILNTQPNSTVTEFDLQNLAHGKYWVEIYYPYNKVRKDFVK